MRETYATVTAGAHTSVAVDGGPPQLYSNSSTPTSQHPFNSPSTKLRAKHLLPPFLHLDRRRRWMLLLTAGLLTHLGGLRAFLATEMHFEFVAPVYIGDTITAETEVAERERGLSLRTPAACRAGS